jgi:hypothetical protein
MSEKDQALILVSSDLGRSNLERKVLSRVILPLDLISLLHDHPGRHIWWVEKRNRGVHLRAKLFLEQPLAGCRVGLPIGLAAYAVDTLRSERITWPGAQTRSANVTAALSGLKLQVVGGISFGVIAPNTERRLERCLASVCEQVFEFEDAARVLRHRFASFDHAGTLRTSRKPGLTQALNLARCSFARQELIGIDGYSPYEVAAAVLAGYTELPNKIARGKKDGLSRSNNADEFAQMDEQRDSALLGVWERNSHARSGMDLLELKTKRHQRMVSLLAAHLRARGFSTTYNRNIDLRAESEGRDFFFEVKTADAENFRKQVRSAVGQLLEYRYRYPSKSGKEIALVAVIEAVASDKHHHIACEFLRGVGIELVLWNSKTGVFEGLNFLLAQSDPATLPSWRFA